MVRIDRVYTRGGDKGETSLGSGTRVLKDSHRVEAYGTLDELNAVIGCILTAEPQTDLIEPLMEIQQQLFDLGGELCVEESSKSKDHRSAITQEDIDSLEASMDEMTKTLEPLSSFILPGGTKAAGHFHLARTVCRRAERRLQTLVRKEPIPELAIPYINRLSDVFFVMARYENKHSGHGDILWDPSRNKK